MKNINGLLLATMTMLFLGMGNVYAQESQTVIIRTVESNVRTSAVNSEMIIIAPDGEKQVVSLLGHKFTDYGDVASKNTIVIQEEIKKWQKQGFEITNFSTDGGDVHQRTFIIMTKK